MVPPWERVPGGADRSNSDQDAIYMIRANLYEFQEPQSASQQDEHMPEYVHLDRPAYCTSPLASPQRFVESIAEAFAEVHRRISELANKQEAQDQNVTECVAAAIRLCHRIASSPGTPVVEGEVSMPPVFPHPEQKTRQASQSTGLALKPTQRSTPPNSPTPTTAGRPPQCDTEHTAGRDAPGAAQLCDTKSASKGNAFDPPAEADGSAGRRPSFNQIGNRTKAERSQHRRYTHRRPKATQQKRAVDHRRTPDRRNARGGESRVPIGH